MLSEGGPGEEGSPGEEGGRATTQLIEHLSDLEEDNVVTPPFVEYVGLSGQEGVEMKDTGLGLGSNVGEGTLILDTLDTPQDIVRLENLLNTDKHTVVVTPFINLDQCSYSNEMPGINSVRYQKIQHKWDKKKRIQIRNRNISSGIKRPSSGITRDCCNKPRDKSAELHARSREVYLKCRDSSRELHKERVLSGDTVNDISLIGGVGSRNRLNISGSDFR